MQELNISGCTGIDATAVANVVAKNRTLSALIFGKRMDEPATLEMGMAEADFSNTSLGVGGAIIISAWITHKDKGAMTSLNLASNDICSYGNMDGIKAISSAVKVLAIILVPFSSLSDLPFNCWCLLLSPGYGGDDELACRDEWHP
jgi:hypothetical protein